MTLRTAQRVVFVKGVLLIALAAVHTVAIPFEHARIRAQLPPRLGHEYAFWFGALGLYFALLGAVDLLASKRLGGDEPLARRIALCSSLFAALSGAGGVAMFRGGPPVLLLVLGLIGTFVLARGRAAQLLG